MKSPLDVISDKMHKNFMQEYLDKWPYVPKVQYCVGQNIFATFNGVLQACEVLITDSSLIQVVFEVGLAAPLQHYLLTCFSQNVFANRIYNCLCNVVFQFTEHKEWIYRGSPRLEHIQRNKMI